MSIYVHANFHYNNLMTIRTEDYIKSAIVILFDSKDYYYMNEPKFELETTLSSVLFLAIIICLLLICIKITVDSF